MLLGYQMSFIILVQFKNRHKYIDKQNDVHSKYYSGQLLFTRLSVLMFCFLFISFFLLLKWTAFTNSSKSQFPFTFLLFGVTPLEKVRKKYINFSL